MVNGGNGTITLNGVTDQELIVILEAKMKNHFQFNPQNMNVQPNNATIYNNVTLVFNGEVGLKAVHELIGKLLKKDQAVASGQ